MLTRLLTKRIPFTFNRAGYYYFSRRVPADLVHHYSYPRIVEGLKTKSSHIAKTRALVAAGKLDEYWSHLRMHDPELIGKNLLREVSPPSSHIIKATEHSTKADISLSEALSIYLSLKGENKGKTFRAAAERACAYLIETCGVKTMQEYSRGDALAYGDYLIAKGLVGSSVSRVLSSIRAVFNLAISEYALDIKNPFIGMYFDKSIGISRRLPIPIANIKKIQRKTTPLETS